MVHNIVIRLRESGKIFVHEGQGQKLDGRNIWECIENRHNSVVEIIAWA